MRPIGIFDSGFGGLFVFRHIAARLPQYDYIYLGDTARAPYGERPQEEVYRFTREAVDFLKREGAGLIILACNTASSDALRRIQGEESARGTNTVLGVLIPAVEAAVHATQSKHIGIIATTGTVASGKYIRELAKLDSTLSVHQSAAPLLVPMIEAGDHNEKLVQTTLHQYLEPLLKENIDVLVLGCTHYGILKDTISKIVGPEITIIASEDVVPLKLEDYLARHSDIATTLTRRGARRFLTTGDTERFDRLGSEFFGQEIKTEQVEIATTAPSGSAS